MDKNNLLSVFITYGFHGAFQVQAVVDINTYKNTAEASAAFLYIKMPLDDQGAFITNL